METTIIFRVALTIFLLNLFTPKVWAGQYCDQKKEAHKTYSEKASEVIQSYKRELRYANRQSAILEKQRKAGVKQSFIARTVRLIQGHLNSAKKNLRNYKKLKGIRQTVARQLKRCKQTERHLTVKAEKDEAKTDYLENTNFESDATRVRKRPEIFSIGSPVIDIIEESIEYDSIQ